VLDGEQGPARDLLGSIETTGRQALVELRRLLGLLRHSEEPELAPQPSLRQLDDLIEQVREAGLPVRLLVEGEPAPLAPGIDLSAYRIVQEGLTNALKHAGPAQARVTVRYSPSDLQLEIADDGTGVAGSAGSGEGLLGMRERVALYGGELVSGRGDDGGYVVRARLPLRGSP
jgi:signal transduction histidine kinase